MRKLIYIFLFVGFCILPAIATAADYAGPVQLVGGALQQATTSVMTQLTGMAFKLLFYFSLLKFTILGIGQIRSGDIEMSIGKFASAFLS